MLKLTILSLCVAKISSAQGAPSLCAEDSTFAQRPHFQMTLMLKMPAAHVSWELYSHIPCKMFLCFQDDELSGDVVMDKRTWLIVLSLDNIRRLLHRNFIRCLSSSNWYAMWYLIFDMYKILLFCAFGS